MFPLYKVRDFFGKYYSISLSVHIKPPQGLQEQIFTDHLSAIRFLRNLSVQENFWQQIIYHVNGAVSYDDITSPLDKVAALFKSGKIKIYQLPRVNALTEFVQNRVFSQHGGSRFQIVPAAMLFNESSVNTRNFASKEEAISYVREAKPDKKQLQALSQLVKKDDQSNGADNIPGQEEKLFEKVAEAIVAGEIAIVEHLSKPPPSETAEASSDPRVDQKAPLAPEVEKKWCHFVLTEKNAAGELEPVVANVSFVLPSGREQEEVTAAENGMASVSVSDQQGTFDIKQVDTLEKNVIYEFVSLA